MTLERVSIFIVCGLILILFLFFFFFGIKFAAQPGATHDRIYLFIFYGPYHRTGYLYLHIISVNKAIKKRHTSMRRLFFTKLREECCNLTLNVYF